jgi:uncharacterized protein DUF1707
MRASDADRDRLVAALQAHAAAGRLSLDEYSDRVAQVFHARTHGELAAVMRDLPAESTVDHPAGARHLILAFLLAIVALAVIGFAVTVFR